MFSAFGPVTVRRMFGGAGIYADGTMFALIADGVIYLKAGEQQCRRRSSAKGSRRSPTRGARASARVMSYRRMPDRLYDDPDELAVWARAALAAALRSAKPRAKRPSRQRRRDQSNQETRARYATLGAAGLATSGSVSQITRLRPLRLAA